VKSFFKNRKLFHQFAISFIITIFLPISIIGGISYYIGTYQIKNMVSELLEQVVVSINLQFDSLVKESDRLSLQFINTSQVQDFIESSPNDYYSKFILNEWSEKQIWINEMLSRFPIISRISIVGDNNIQYSIVNDKSGDSNAYLFEFNETLNRSEYYKNIIKPDGSVSIIVNKLFKDEEYAGENASKSDFYLTFARRIFSKVPFVSKGTLFIDINVNSLQKLWGEKDIKDGFIWIVSDDGRIVYYPDSNKIGQMADTIVNHQLLEKDSDNFTMKWNDKNYFFVYDTSANTGWKVIATIPAESVYKPIKNMSRTILYTLLIAFPLALALAYTLIRSILKPIYRLERGMKEIGEENWTEIKGEIPDNEIGMLIKNYNRMTREISNLIDKVYKTELEQKEIQLDKQEAEYARQKAEFQALQTQINPHFLYNTLNAINTYALMVDENAIQEMVEALSKMLRYAVQNPLELVRLENEIEHSICFLTIQKHRCKHMPSIEWRVEDCVGFPTLRLTLQPLIENVFQHAFPEGIKPEHKIVISAFEENGLLTIIVEDNGVGIEGIEPGDVVTLKNASIKYGIGLMNVQKRLQIAYGPENGLMIGKRKEGGTIIKMVLPVNENILHLE
jgi:Predicted signal transduction protein with a C-terminal ATPase domain